jgi:hypothetical protein
MGNYSWHASGMAATAAKRKLTAGLLRHLTNLLEK